MKKYVLLNVIILGLLFMTNCSQKRTFENAQVGHWKVIKSKLNSQLGYEYFISENKIYIRHKGKLNKALSYKIVGENKDEYKKDIDLLTELGIRRIYFIFSPDLKTFQWEIKKYPNFYFTLMFIDNNQNP